MGMTKEEIEALTDVEASRYVAEKIMGYKNPSYHFLRAAQCMDDSIMAAAKIGCRLEIILWPGNPALVRAEWPNEERHDFVSIEYEGQNVARTACLAVIAANEAHPYCEHEWVPVENEVVQGVEICKRCKEYRGKP